MLKYSSEYQCDTLRLLLKSLSNAYIYIYQFQFQFYFGLFLSLKSSGERTQLRVMHLEQLNRQVKSKFTCCAIFFSVKTSVLNINDRDLNGVRVSEWVKAVNERESGNVHWLNFHFFFFFFLIRDVDRFCTAVLNISRKMHNGRNVCAHEGITAEVRSNTRATIDDDAAAKR